MENPKDDDAFASPLHAEPTKNDTLEECAKNEEHDGIPHLSDFSPRTVTDVVSSPDSGVGTADEKNILRRRIFANLIDDSLRPTLVVADNAHVWFRKALSCEHLLTAEQEEEKKSPAHRRASSCDNLDCDFQFTSSSCHYTKSKGIRRARRKDRTRSKESLDCTTHTRRSSHRRSSRRIKSTRHNLDTHGEDETCNRRDASDNDKSCKRLSRWDSGGDVPPLRKNLDMPTRILETQPRGGDKSPPAQTNRPGCPDSPPFLPKRCVEDNQKSIISEKDIRHKDISPNCPRRGITYTLTGQGPSTDSGNNSRSGNGNCFQSCCNYSCDTSPNRNCNAGDREYRSSADSEKTTALTIHATIQQSFNKSFVASSSQSCRHKGKTSSLVSSSQYVARADWLTSQQ